MLLENRLWVRQYLTNTQLSLDLGVSVSSVSSNLKRMWLTLWEECGQPEFVAGQNWYLARNAERLGCINEISHEMLTPSNEPDEEFYSGHRKYHCIHTQVC